MNSIRQRVSDGLDVMRGLKRAHDISDVNVRKLTGLYAQFGQKITFQDIDFAIRREPVAYRIVVPVASDVFNKWFTIDNDETKEPDPKLDKALQNVLSSLKARSIFTLASAYERAYGWSIIVLGYDDFTEDLSEPVKNPKDILELAAYSPKQISGIDDVTDRSDLRYGFPETYHVMQNYTRQIHIHFSRVIHLATRLWDHPYRGISALEPVYDDITILRNMRWGLGQTIYRYGSGFPDITLNGANKAAIEAFYDSRQFEEINARTSFAHSEKQSLEFKGVGGVTLNPTNYYIPILESISLGTGIPVAILRGAQAGALTGSEVNLQEYFKIISSLQELYSPAVRELVDKILSIGRVQGVSLPTVTNYTLNWNSGFELSERDKGLIELNRVQALQIQSGWRTLDELRVLDKVKPLNELEGYPTPEDGNIIPGLRSSAPQVPNGQGPPGDPDNPEGQTQTEKLREASGSNNA
ncbi:MAG: hypothetical protein QG670_898 [Thermoproteota archaeon]|nr:hypothetical protein [Thermoproteota archaeon]